MNGRIYDPQLGRFLSADKYVQFPGNLQSFNRYSYVQNNPLTHTDSTGELIDTIWDIGSAVVGVIEVGANLYAGDWGEAAVAAGGVAIDVGAAFVPFVPGGASVAIKAGREGAELVAREVASEGAEKITKEAAEKVTKEAPALKQVDNVAPDTKLDVDVDTNLSKGESGKNLASEGTDATKTETVQRMMSKDELKATEDTGLIRGGRDGTHHVSDAANSDARRAQQRLSLPQEPEVRVTLEVPEGKFSPPSKVEPDNNMPGGGMERTAEGKIPVIIKKVDEL